VLLGFSQGASVALPRLPRLPRRHPAVPGCGDTDPHLPKRRVDETATVFGRLGAAVTQRVYPGLGHAIHPDEIVVARGMVDAVWA